jgi:cephalosporin-C deacetylase-like acetyl esterase
MNVEHWTDSEIKRACSFTDYNERLYEILLNQLKETRPILRIPNDFQKWQENLRKDLIRLLKIDDLLKSQKEIIIVQGRNEFKRKFKKLEIKHFYIKSWMDTLIPVYLCIPNNSSASKPHPAVVCLHGHLMKKENLVGLRKNLVYPGTWAKDLAEMGCITISSDQWGFGERGQLFRKKKNNFDHFERKYGLNMMLLGRTINGLRVFDAIQQVNYLLSRNDVDTTKIGIAGLSLGGTISAYTAALDERVDIALVAGFLSTFKASILDKNHCSDNYIPDMLNYAELYDILSLIAPRKLFFINGVKDPIFPIESAVQSFNRIHNAYEIYEKKENLGLDVTPYGHRWSGAKAYKFVRNHWF